MVIGASAGGIRAISQLLSYLPEKTEAAFLVVLHQSADSNPEIIKGIFEKNSRLKCIVPKEETLLKGSTVYIAPSNYHMMIKPGVVTINNGPRENRYRPSINVLFRSAAVYYGPRVIAIILTGMLDDGTSGMVAVKQCGGTAIVQDPADAEYSQMPVHVLNKINADHVLTLSGIREIIGNLLKAPIPPEVPLPAEIKAEVEMTERIMVSLDQLKKIADRTDFICPDCGGGLWKVKNDPSDRYRCHVGHVYSGNRLLQIHSQEVEESLWVSVRMLEERRNMMQAMLKEMDESGLNSAAGLYRDRIQETEKHISSLKTLLTGYSDDLPSAGDRIA